MIEYIKGDLVKSDCDVIIHGCNCFCNMGAGIAKQIRETYPEAYETDKLTTRGDKNKLGQISYTRVVNKYFPDKVVYVVNAYTQFTYGRKDGEIYADYIAIREAMVRINELFSDTHDVQFKIGLPKIGAGLARGDWNIISKTIDEVFGDRKIYVYEWDNGEVKKEEFDLKKLKEEWKKHLDTIYKADNEKDI